MNLIHKTKTWLLDNNILVPDDWVTACIEWIQEEHQVYSEPAGVPQTQDQINSLVYEQWLLADLHELETRCLPTSVIEADKFQLTGTYALQIDSILDVGQSFYSQQQKVRGTENANVGVTAEEQTLKPWEQKPTRMLMFKLTDGSQTVQGMEYKKISCLSPQTQPGSKIVIHGSILCRHGVLMLSENNIKFLGGEVDTLVEANTQINVLESAMEASTEHAGKSHRQEFEGSDVRPSQKPVLKPAVQRFGGQQNVVPGSNRARQSQGFEKEDRKIKKEVQSTQVQQRASVVDDQWDDDQMLDALMDDMETDDFQQPQNNYSSQTGAVHGVRSGTFNPAVNTGISVSRDDKPFSSDVSQANKGNISVKSVNLGNVKKETSLALPKREVNHRITNKSSIRKNDVYSLPVKRQRTSSDNNTVEDDDLFGDDDDFAEVRELEQMDPGPAHDHENKVINKFTSHTNSSVSVTGKSNLALNSDRNSLKLNQNWNNNLLGADCKRENLEMQMKAEPNMTGSSVHSKSAKSVSQSDTGRKGNIPTDRFFSPAKQTAPNVSDSANEYPFTYLSKVLNQRPSETKIVTVKAYISTLTSKLSSDNGRWSLSCKINDGTMACDVDLSNKVLTDLIGFSTEDAKVMKLRARSDKTVKEALQKGIQHCQQKLIELMCLMEIDMSSQSPKPAVVALKDISSNDIELLYNRVISSWNIST